MCIVYAQVRSLVEDLNSIFNFTLSLCVFLDAYVYKHFTFIFTYILSKIYYFISFDGFFIVSFSFA